MSWTEIMPGVYRGWSVPEVTQETESLLRLSNIPAETIESHRLTTWAHSGEESWWHTIGQYSDGVYNHPFLTFLGGTGVGKTHLAFALAWEWLLDGRTVLYYQVERLLDALRRGYGEGADSKGYDNLLQYVEGARLLILDDFGAQKETEWAVAKLDQIIDYRYENKKPLIVTTNLALTRLPPRIADRLSEGQLIQLTGQSFRRQRKMGTK